MKEGETTKTLILDTGTGFNPLCESSSISLKEEIYWSDVDFKIKEPLKFSNQCDVFLESLTINNPTVANNISDIYIVFEFDFMNETTFSNSNDFSRKFCIPNENTTANGTNTVMKYQFKSNYLGVFDRGILENINIKIKNENGDSLNSLKPLRVIETYTTNVFVGTIIPFNIITISEVNISETRVEIDVVSSTSPYRPIKFDKYYLSPNEPIYTKNGTLIGNVVSNVFNDGVSGDWDDQPAYSALCLQQVNTTINRGEEFYFAPNRTKYIIKGPGNAAATFSLNIGANNIDDYNGMLNMYDIEYGHIDGNFFPPYHDGNDFHYGIKKPSSIGISVVTVNPNSLDGDQVPLADTLNNFFKRGQPLYTYKGEIIGTYYGSLDLYNPGPFLETRMYFEDGLLIPGYITPIFTSPPNVVFNGNSKSNRLIMELSFREKKDNNISLQ